jgi:hypothetical protein
VLPQEVEELEAKAEQDKSAMEKKIKQLQSGNSRYAASITLCTISTRASRLSRGLVRVSKAAKDLQARAAGVRKESAQQLRALPQVVADVGARIAQRIQDEVRRQARCCCTPRRSVHPPPGVGASPCSTAIQEGARGEEAAVQPCPRAAREHTRVLQGQVAAHSHASKQAPQ